MLLGLEEGEKQFKNDMQAGTLHGADEYSVRINSTWVLKNKK